MFVICLDEFRDKDHHEISQDDVKQKDINQPEKLFKRILSVSLVGDQPNGKTVAYVSC